MKQELSKEEIYLLARIEKVDAAILLRMRHLFDVKSVRRILILFEYKEQAKDRRIKKVNIKKALMQKYGVSKTYIEQIIYNQHEPVKGKQCVRCGKLITTYYWNRNDGVCNKCKEKGILKSLEDDKERDVEHNENSTG